MHRYNGPIIDIHCHLFPENMFAAIWDFFETRGWQVHRQHIDQIAETFRQHHVRYGVGLSYPHKIGVAAYLNRFMAEVAAEYDLFLPFGSVYVDDPDLREQTDFVLDSPKLHGFKFQPLVQRFDITDQRLDYLYSACVERDFPLLMHIGTAPYGNEFLGFSHFKKLIDRFPDLRVCVAHMGAFEVDEFLDLVIDHEKMVLDTAVINVPMPLFDSTWDGNREKLAAHSDRVCFGSDWPNVPYSYHEALESIDRFPFDADALPGIYYENARRFLKLPD